MGANHSFSSDCTLFQAESRGRAEGRRQQHDADRAVWEGRRRHGRRSASELEARRGGAFSSCFHVWRILVTYYLQSCFQFSKPKVANVTGDIGVATAGLYPDARSLLEMAVDEAKKHLGELRQPIPIEKLVESVRFAQLFE